MVVIEFPKDFKEFLQLLDSKGIEYLVVGGYRDLNDVEMLEHDSE